MARVLLSPSSMGVPVKIDHQPIVVVGVVVIEQPQRSRAGATIGAQKFNGDAIDQVVVKLVIGVHQQRRADEQQFSHHLINGVCFRVGVELCQRAPQPVAEDDILIRRALRVPLAGGVIGAIRPLVAEFFQPGEGGLLHHIFGELFAHYASPHRIADAIYRHDSIGR